MPLLWAAPPTPVTPSPEIVFDQKVGVSRLHARLRGPGGGKPYLLIVHGGPGFSSAMFLPWGRSLEGDINVVYMDQRGTGESERLKFKSLFSPTPDEAAPFALANLVADIESVRVGLKIDRWFVLGHSWGGMLGAAYVAAHPKTVRGFIQMDGLVSQPWEQEDLLDRAIADDPKNADRYRTARALPAGPGRLQAAYAYVFPHLAALYSHDPAAFAAYQKAIGEEAVRSGIPRAALAPANEAPIGVEAANGYSRRDVFAELNAVAAARVPTLVLRGASDGVISARSSAEAARRLRTTAVTLDKSGHFPFAEEPEKTRALILDFIRRH